MNHDNDNDKSRIEEWLNLEIYRVTDGFKKDIQVTPQLFAGQMLTELIQDGVLPPKDSRGTAHNWELHNLRTERTLEPNCSVGEQCRSGDRLNAHPEAIGGAYEQARLMRVQREIAGLHKLAEQQPWLTIQSTAPDSAIREISEAYLLRIACPGITEVARQQGGGYQVSTSHNHQAYLYLRCAYPNDPPLFYMKSSHFHPNIRESDGLVCLREATTAYRPGYSLHELVEGLRDLIGYKIFNPTDFFNSEAVIFALTSPDQIAAIGGKPFVAEAVSEERVRKYLQWLMESDRKGDFWALQCWLRDDRQPLAPVEKGVRYPSRENQP